MTTRAPSFLVSTEWLTEHLSDPALRLYDATAGLSTAPGGHARTPASSIFDQIHIPGARYLDLKNDLSDTASELDFTRLPPESAAKAFAQAGIGAENFVVVYSSSTYGWATRIWWLLNDIGFDRVAVLDGGLVKWVQEGRATESGPGEPYKAAVPFSPQTKSLFADLADVATIVDAGGATLVNALSAEHFSGAAPGPHGRRGHIPGSINLPASAFVSATDNSLKPLETLQADFHAKGIFTDTDVVAYCGSGIAATLDGFLLRATGHDKVRVYDGSLSEWSRAAERPLEA